MMSTVHVITITKAEYLKGYQIRLEFNDGKIQIIDFHNFITLSRNPSILKYANLELFRQFSITDGDLEWNDYDLCFPIADLYQNKNIGIDNHDSNVAA